MSTKNYVYGAHEPTSNLASVRDQMHAAHRYRNKLCELERTRRAASESTIRRLSPEYAALAEAYDRADAAVTAAYDALKRDRKSARKRVDATPEQAAAIKAAKDVRDAATEAAKKSKALAYAALKELQAPYWLAADAAVPDDGTLKPATRKRRVREAALAALAAVELDAGQFSYERDQKQARADCGAYWGTYLTVEDAAKDFGKGPPPRFLPWTGDGTIGVQLMGGLSVDDAIACTDSRLRIELANEEELATKGWSRCARSIGTAWLRIGSEGSDPIWAKVPVRFHRPLPRNGDIRWAFLHRRRVARGDKWLLRLTINEPEPDEAPRTDTSTVALHLGWRVMPDDSLRTAVWVGSDGRRGEIAMDAAWLAEDAKIASVQAERDLTWNEFRPRLLKWLLDQVDILPEWMLARIESIGLWESLERFASLAMSWRDQRFPGDEFMYRDFAEWQKHDKRRLQHQERLRSRLIARRADLYRRTLKKLAAEYSTLAVAKVEWKKLAKRERTDEDITQTAHQRHHARLASPGLMTALAGEYFVGRIRLVDAADITSRCHACGCAGEARDRSKLVQTCGVCGAKWDQDANAALNTLASAAVSRETPVALADSAAQGVKVAGVGVAAVGDGAKTGTARKRHRNRRASQVIE